MTYHRPTSQIARVLASRATYSFGTIEKLIEELRALASDRDADPDERDAAEKMRAISVDVQERMSVRNAASHALTRIDDR